MPLDRHWEHLLNMSQQLKRRSTVANSQVIVRHNVDNTPHVRRRQQAICPVLGWLPKPGSGDHGTGAGDAAEKADEVRGALRKAAGRSAEPGGRGKGAGHFGADLPALGGALRGGGRRRPSWPPARPRCGQPGPGGHRGGGAGAARHDVPRLHGEALLREARGRVRLRVRLQPAAREAPGRGARPEGEAPRRAPPEAAPEAGAGDAAATGRVSARAGSGQGTGPGPDDGRRDERGAFGVLRRGGRHDGRLPRPLGDDRAQGPVPLALREPGVPLPEDA